MRCALLCTFGILLQKDRNCIGILLQTRGNNARKTSQHMNRGEAGMRYYIADCHFYHKNLLTEMDNRDFESVEQINEVMIEKWNKGLRS